jgi:hypothetical protein
MLLLQTHRLTENSSIRLKHSCNRHGTPHWLGAVVKSWVLYASYCQHRVVLRHNVVIPSCIDHSRYAMCIDYLHTSRKPMAILDRPLPSPRLLGLVLTSLDAMRPAPMQDQGAWPHLAFGQPDQT